jgi:hypothetical protein
MITSAFACSVSEMCSIEMNGLIVRGATVTADTESGPLHGVRRASGVHTKDRSKLGIAWHSPRSIGRVEKRPITGRPFHR